VRSAAEPANREEPLESKLVGDRRDIRRAVGHGSIDLAIGLAVAWTRIGDVAQAPRGACVYQRREHLPRARRACVEDDRPSVGWTRQLDVEPAAASNCDLQSPNHHRHDNAPRAELRARA